MRLRSVVFILLCANVLMLSAQQTEQTSLPQNRDSELRLGAHPWRTADTLAQKKAYWSVAVEAGFDIFSGDMKSTGVDLVPFSQIRPYGGISFQCDFTPILGLAFGYSYANYGAKRTADDWLVYGHNHSLEAMLTVDLVDAWNTKRENTLFSWYVFAGGGAGAFYSTLNDGINPPVVSAENNKYTWYGFATVGTLFEFNVSRSFGLGAKVEYHINGTDHFDALKAGVTNDHLPYVGLQLRWKIGATTRNHIRNVSQSIFNDADRMAGKGKKKGGNKDTLVIANLDTLYLATETERVIERHQIERVEVVDVTSTANQARYNVYFANGKDVLDKYALQEIQKVASLMEEDDSLYVAITGFSDNTASAQLNESLSKRRANRVKNELVKIYGIDEDRIVAMGLGIIRNTASSYSANRRVEMRLVSEDDFEKVKVRKDSLERIYNKTKVSQKPKIVSTTVSSMAKAGKSRTLSETVDTLSERKSQTVTPEPRKAATVEQAKAAAAKPLAQVTADGTTTLMKLAKQYYGDADYWPYIYEANQQVLTTPTRVEPGTQIKIPRLTEQQKKASKQALEKLANKYLL